MRVYIWANPYDVSYGSSMLFAVADSEEEARTTIQTRATWWAHIQYQTRVSNYADPPAPMKVGSTLELGTPLRVLDVPCAEFHEWSE